MEKEGVQPDVLVEDHPDQLAKGIDLQLDKAVEVLRNDVLVWKKKQETSTARKTSEGGPVSQPTVTPVSPPSTVPPGK